MGIGQNLKPTRTTVETGSCLVIRSYIPLQYCCDPHPCCVWSSFMLFYSQFFVGWNTSKTSQHLDGNHGYKIPPVSWLNPTTKWAGLLNPRRSPEPCLHRCRGSTAWKKWEKIALTWHMDGRKQPNTTGVSPKKRWGLTKHQVLLGWFKIHFAYTVRSLFSMTVEGNHEAKLEELGSRAISTRERQEW